MQFFTFSNEYSAEKVVSFSVSMRCECSNRAFDSPGALSLSCSTAYSCFGVHAYPRRGFSAYYYTPPQLFFRVLLYTASVVFPRSLYTAKVYFRIVYIPPRCIYKSKARKKERNKNEVQSVVSTFLHVG